MSAKSVVLCLTLENCIKISKWKVQVGNIVSVGRVLLLYDAKSNTAKPEVQKLKATAVGTVRKLLAMEGDVVRPGDPLLELEKCTHPTVMKDMCAECGADLRNEEARGSDNIASIPMVHSVPELKVNAEQAQILGKADEKRLLTSRKLVLLVDLDQTLIHTTNDNIPSNLKDVFHFRLHGSLSPWHHTRLRPGTKSFLKVMSDYYELHICTFGSRMYAHVIANFLDPNGQYFSHRILSRDECFSANSKIANLKALFPCGDNMVCIIDDREDVWNFAPNLIHVKPYHFFQHTGDINAPPGLAKCENDDKGEYDFNCLGGWKNVPERNGKTISVPPHHMGKGAPKSSQEDNKALDLVKCKTLKSDNEKASLKSSKITEINDSGSNSNVSESGPAEDSIHSGTVEGTQLEVSAHLVETKSFPDDINRKDSDQVDQEELKNDGSADKRSAADAHECASCSDALVIESVGVENFVISENLVNVNEEQDLKVLESHPQCQDSDIKNKESAPERTKLNEKTESSAIDKDSTNDLGNVQKTNEIEVQDSDDYLLYLEDILKRIHDEFYRRADEGESPDLKEVVPSVRRKVLDGTSLVFSGLVPNNVPLERSRAYQVAISLGAKVTQDLKKNTTHLVAVRPRTVKVNSARHMKGLFMVTADWLWTCAERWEHVDEKIFPLGRNRAGSRHPPAHCGSPEHSPALKDIEPVASGGRSRTASGRFMDTINPLLSFSSADIADMDQEVNDIFNESESDGEGDNLNKKQKMPVESELERASDNESQCVVLPSSIRADSDSSSSSADSLSGEHPHGWRSHDLKRKQPTCGPGTGTATESDGDDETDDMPSAKFRRGEALPSDLDMGENDSESQGSLEPPDDIDDGDWNMMGAALEREFLS